MRMHERHVRECCLWLITSRTTTFQLPINKAIPAAFQRLCRGDSGSRIPPDSPCTSPWPLGGLYSDPPILWDYVKVEGELIGCWLIPLKAFLYWLWCVWRVLKLPTGSHFAPVIQPFPEPFLSLLETVASCVPQEGQGALMHRGLIPYLAIRPFTCSPASIS